MAASDSLDLRRQVVQACERPARSQRAVAEFFGVSLSFVEGLLRQVRRSGELAPLRGRPGSHAKIDGDACQCRERWLQKQPELTLAELAARLQARWPPGSEHACSMPGAAAPGPAPKKKTVHASEPGTTQVRVRHAIDTGKTLPAMPPRG
ncbi:MAG: hypothetical protein JWR68_1963 [Polaromonas sp.]|nr:hypothetical protein [Polaromonas sp.]